MHTATYCIVVNRLNLYIAFVSCEPLTVLHNDCLAFTHSYTHSYTGSVNRAAGFRCVALGHLSTRLLGLKQQPSGCQTTALPPEPLALSHCSKCAYASVLGYGNNITNEKAERWKGGTRSPGPRNEAIVPNMKTPIVYSLKGAAP